MSNKWIPVLLLITFVAGCSSSKPTRDDGTYWLGVHEDFDPDQHPEAIPALPAVENDHDIPAGLEDHAAPNEVVTAHGFRIQVHASRDKQEADVAMRQILTWWEAHRTERTTNGVSPIYMDYEQPFYKVRAGNYVSRGAAADDLRVLARRFDGSFLVPAAIVITN